MCSSVWVTLVGDGLGVRESGLPHHDKGAHSIGLHISYMGGGPWELADDIPLRRGSGGDCKMSNIPGPLDYGVAEGFGTCR